MSVVFAINMGKRAYHSHRRHAFEVIDLNATLTVIFKDLQGDITGD